MKSKKTKKYRHRPLPLVLAIATLALCVIGGTIAYVLSIISDPIINPVQFQTVDIVAEKAISGSQLTSVTVKNPGNALNAPCYIRVALVFYATDGDSQIFDITHTAPTITADDLEEGWVRHTDGYYYYARPVEPGTTIQLLKSSISMAGNQTVTVLAQAIQATPENAVKDAWGVDPGNL